MQPTEPPLDASLLSQQARQVADKFTAGEQHVGLQQMQSDTFGLNDKGVQQFFQSLAMAAQKAPNHHLPGLEITEGSGHQLKVVAHDGKKTDVLFDSAATVSNTFEAPTDDQLQKKRPDKEQKTSADKAQKPSADKVQKATADVDEEQKSPPVQKGEGYYQPLKRMHPDWTHKQLMDKIHEIKGRVGQDHVLKVGERFDTMSPEEKKAAVAARTGQTEDKKETPDHKEPGHKPGHDGPAVRPAEKTADGGVTTYDVQGNATTHWKNGGERVQNKDGTGYVKTPDGKGGYHEHHWGPKQTDNFETDRKIENAGGADAAYQKRVGDAYSKLPEGVRKKLDQAGIHVVTAGKATDVHPEWKGQHPRGYPPGVDFGVVDGVFDGTKIIMPEHSDSKTKPDPEGVMRHEAGHAFDKVLGDYSSSPEFNDAYQKDLAKLTPEQRKQLDYYLQKDGAGQQELFAELFCSATGGRPDKDHYPLDMAKLFPETYKLVQKKINDAN